METKKVGTWTALIGFTILFGVPAVLFLVILGRFAATPWTAASVVFGYVVRQVTDASGWNSNLVKGVTVLALIPFAFAVLEMVRFRGGSRQRRQVAQVVFALYLATFYFVMAKASEGNRWTTSGRVTKWYSVTPEGIREFDADSLQSSVPRDPKYGVPLKPVTPEIAASIERAKRGLQPTRISSSEMGDLRFFDGATGMPLVWYFARPDGGYDLFSSAGFHPQFNEPLQPVTGEIVQRVLAQAREEKALAVKTAGAHAAKQADDALGNRQRRYMSGRPPTGTWIVAIRDGHSDPVVAAQIAELLGGASIFSDAFVDDGLAAKLIASPRSVVDELGLGRAAAVVAVSVSLNTRKNESVGEGLLTSDVVLSLRSIHPQGDELVPTEGRGTGTGFTQAKAEAMGIERAIEQLRSKRVR